MPIWKKPIDLALLEAANRNTAVEHLGIEFVEVGDDFLRARVPVDHRTVQPFRLLHGGVSVVLAESLGSTGAYYTLPEGYPAPPPFSQIARGFWEGGHRQRGGAALARRSWPGERQFLKWREFERN